MSEYEKCWPNAVLVHGLGKHEAERDILDFAYRLEWMAIGMLCVGHPRAKQVADAGQTLRVLAKELAEKNV